MASESDYLSASEIEAIDERARLWKARGIEQTGSVADDRAALLRHLDALTAPADGEALGRELLRQIELPANQRPTWAEIAIGIYRRGALSREGEIAALRRSIEIETFRGDVATKLADIRDATIARLTAERDAARDCGQAGVCATPPGCARHWEERNHELQAQVESFQRNSGCVDGYTIGDALAKIGASLGRTPTEGIPDAIERLKREKAAARADGAREERERLMQQVGSLSTPRETPAFRSAIAAAIDAMGEGHKVDEGRARGDR